MKVQELTTKDFLSHLRRHPIPEIMDDVCLASLSSVEEQYGDTITHGAGLEVRLGEEARYVDYIMNIDEDAVPGVENLWYEIDFEEFQKAHMESGRIVPCLFANTGFRPDDKTVWDRFLPSFLGQTRAEKLRGPLDRVLHSLPEGAFIKQIGTMTSRGELAIMRLVIMFPSWETVPGGLFDIGWKGDTAKLRDALEPWRETKNIAVNIDLGENGVLPKIGVEVFSRWRQPILVDKFIARLEKAGLCLESKGEALRRWIRILPEGDPFIQTLISYFKLGYRDGRITEAKAYLEQTPYVHHHYFSSYEHPIRLDMELAGKGSFLSIDKALECIRQCRQNRVRSVRLYGSEQYEHMEDLTKAIKESGMTAAIVLEKCTDPKWLAKMHGTGIVSFLVEIKKPSPEDEGMKTLSLLKEMKISPVSAVWYMNAENAGELEDLAECAKELGVSELVANGMCAGTDGKTSCSLKDIESAAEFIKRYNSSQSGMEITAGSCFSPLRAFMGGRDPKKNENRGITRGCEAGRSFMAVRADGKYTSCLKAGAAGQKSSLDRFWEKTKAEVSLQKNGVYENCTGCTYVRRCLPCPAMMEQGMSCPLR